VFYFKKRYPWDSVLKPGGIEKQFDLLLTLFEKYDNELDMLRCFDFLPMTLTPRSLLLPMTQANRPYHL
jgi:hypothetical protein